MSPNLPIDSMDRAPSHHKPAIPRASDIAARLAAGETLAVIAAEVERTESTLGALLNRQGFSAVTGLAMTPEWTPTPVMGRAWEFPAWFDDALCAETGGDLHYPEKDGSTGADAKAICRECPVRLQCLEYALLNDERYGVWGGLSANQRRRLKQRRSAS